MQNARFERSTVRRNRLLKRLALSFASLFALAVAITPAHAMHRIASLGPSSRAAAVLQVMARTHADTGQTASVTGTVYDSVTSSPLVGAEVQLINLDDRSETYNARTDSLGRFHVDAIHPGRYVAGFFHPSLEALGIQPPLRNAIINAGSGNLLELVVPGAARVMTAVCGARSPADSGGAMAGLVLDADSALPIAGAKVVVTWLEIVIDNRGIVSNQRRVPAQTGESGEYRICGLPGADTVIANAESLGRRSGLVGVPIPIGGIVRRDFTLGDSASAIAVVPDSNTSPDVRRETTVLRGSARLAGLVHGPDGKPMQGAKIIVWGTGLLATTQGDGRFSLRGLPAGTFSVEARMLGFEPKRVSVDLSSKRPASVDITFKERVVELSRVVVMGKMSRRGLDLDGFIRRSHTGFGHYITATDNSLKTAFALSDALRATAGVQIVPSGSFGHVILVRGRCGPVVYLDGIQVIDGYKTLDDIISPQQVAGIEVYAGVGGAPAQYQSNGCGVLLVWTKR